MTNKDKYLKDGVSVEEFAKSILNDSIYEPTEEDIIAFLNKTCKPTLTEDERVILRNIKNGYKYIYKTTEKHLMLSNVSFKIKGTYISTRNIDQYNHLFQFIKERRRI